MAPKPLTRRAVLGAGLALGVAGCASDDAEPEEPDAAARYGPDDPGAVVVRAREGWGAVPARDGAVEHEVTRLTVHHSAYRLRDNARAAAQLRSLQREHLGSGWPDIAYHYLVDLAGVVHEGRDPGTAGDSYTPYDTAGHLQVCLLGHFDAQPVTPAQLAGLTAILAWGAFHHGAGTDTIAGHGDHEPSTPCPGRNLTRIVHDGSLRAAVDRRLGEAEPRLVLLPPR
ncbi:N-acetylmuramoyl-L-alanine amidase [Nocardioides pantholopis]|uniref:N-acetylmuramoyl-L-alanine amidase n=1 Tax=Nocardioides pantholopis TaxID=2483798 RepID=UPI000FDB19D0|nr:N-acetylmuramoyl-L-alanine amidase [Nocardioides pantholopis]